jgi:hypothetical protein
MFCLGLTFDFNLKLFADGLLDEDCEVGVSAYGEDSE